MIQMHSEDENATNLWTWIKQIVDEEISFEAKNVVIVS